MELTQQADQTAEAYCRERQTHWDRVAPQMDSWTGRVKKSYDYYRKADLFVLPSRYEGLPNALCEAMVCGLPVIAANCSDGLSEVLEDGVNGVLVSPEDIDGLSVALASLMADPERRACLGLQAGAIATRFGLERVMRMWEDLLTSVILRERSNHRRIRENIQ
jgi:GalNAc-alpha-(1->4)-GalNAc-alpha-(1->3)-diNAcBac-PP-undecaprenol alpha-1,4-N-acetyl-D-galactosaminyltransferase